MSGERQKRREQIQRGFVVQLVCDLLEEGNAAFREGDSTEARDHFSEGVNVALYAQAEGLNVPAALLESLYINRAAVHQNMGEFDSSVEDCDRALGVCKDSAKALYRKAVCLKESGKLREAYDCSTACLLASPQVNTDCVHVQCFLCLTADSDWPSPVLPAPVPVSDSHEALGLSGAVPLSVPVSQPLEDNELMGDELDSLLDCMSKEEDSSVLFILLLYHLIYYFIINSIILLFINNQSVFIYSYIYRSIYHFFCHSIYRSICHSIYHSVYYFNPSIFCFSIIIILLFYLSSLSGPGVLDFEFRPDVSHSCKKNLLLCRWRGGTNSPWRRIRPRPTHNNFQAAFVLCREVLESQVCKYGEGCTFAYCQEEIDVWTQERRGLLVRELLFNPLSTNERQAPSVIELLNIHTGMFMFLCEACFDCRPRMISKRWKENPALCANVPTQHQFDKKKCLVHVVKSSSVSYSKIRALSSRCQFDVCRHEFSLGCKRKDGCCFAHSLIELQIWILQRDTGITHEEIVQESKKHWNQHAEVKGHRLELMMKFVCSQCWRDGLVSEPDRALKYCTAKARHSWTKDRRVLLVKSQERKKWVAVRPLPFAKTFPQQYDICIHVLKQRKCHYIGNCSFAHSQEEKDLWTYMKNNGFRDIQQVFDVWLSTSSQNRASDSTSPSQPMEEKQITMPTDFAEAMHNSFYCYLCGKHSNSDRQWQQHISTEKHKQRVFSGEGEDESLAWSFRFPGPCFSICPRLEDGCSDGASCDFAHSEEELQEWCKRRDFLRSRLHKARAEMLISPTDNEFGILNFLLQD
uniref:Zinc finger CCCH-type containing 7Ba n=1 Tax=Cyprinus carpio TaxID=7962 RepID=A0A8C1NDQ0_CYPCA